MKTKFLTTLMMLFVTICSAQNLEFNQVILIDSIADTVPAGKVWKVENVLIGNKTFVKFQASAGGSCGCSSSHSYAHYDYVTAYTVQEFADWNNIEINGVEYCFHPQNNISNVIWIPAGSTVRAVQQMTPVQQSSPGGTGCYAPWWLDGVYQNCNAFTPSRVLVTPLVSVIEFNIVP